MHHRWSFSAILIIFVTLIATPLKSDSRLESAIASFIPLRGLSVASADIHLVSPEEVRAQRIFARWEEGSIFLERFHVRQEDGIIHLDLEGLRLTRPDVQNILLSFSGSFSFTRIPRLTAHADWVCRLAQITQRAHIRDISLQWGSTDIQRRATRAEFLPHFFGQSISLDANPDPVACRFIGNVSASDISTRDMDGTLTRIKTLDTLIDIPLEIETARVDPGFLQVDLEMTGFERTDNREIPQFGVSRSEMRVSAPSRQAVGVVMLLRGLMADSSSYTPERLFLEGWNAFHILRPEIDFSFKDTRLFLPGVIPMGLHANFGRAGITNAQASSSGRLSFENSIGNLDLNLYLFGISEISFSSEFRSRSVSSENIRSVMSRSETLGRRDLAELKSFDLSFTDSGLTRVSNDMFGIPPGRLVEEIQGLMMEGEYDEGFLDAFLSGVARALRISQASERARVSLVHSNSAYLSLPRQIAEWFAGETSPGDDHILQISP